MDSNFKRSWSFWGGRKRFDHKFNNSFDDDFEGPRVRLEDRFHNPVYERNQFQTRSLRFDRRIIIPQNNYQSFNCVNSEFNDRQRAHSQWSKNIQRSLGFETLHSPHQTKFKAQLSNQEQRNPSLMYTPKMYQKSNQHNEPIYENINSIVITRPALLPTPMDSPSVRPLQFPEEEMDTIPELPPRNSTQVVEQSTSQGEQMMQRGGARLNKAFQGVCTSMKTFSQRFRKKTKRHYQLDSSPCTPVRTTPGNNLYPFDLNTPMTPHSFKRGTKRLQGSARRQLAGKENYGISRTPNRTNWTHFSPMRIPNERYRAN